MSPSGIDAIVRWFAHCGQRYVEAYLGHVDRERLAVDAHYGLKLFLFMWAFERAGAPRAYRIAAVKAVSSLNDSRPLPVLFKEFYRGKLNPKANPVLDPRIRKLNVPDILALVGTGALHEAFSNLALRGVGHKLRAFFLRDIVTLLNAESKLRANPETYLWCQPIDVWVRMAATELCRGRLASPAPQGSQKRFRLSRQDLAAARGVVQFSLEAGVSPLAVNQGIWYFSSNVAADQRRLQSLLRSRHPRSLDAELALMKGFLPTRPMWG